MPRTFRTIVTIASAVIALTATQSSAAVPPRTTPSHTIRIAFYGDSLSYQAIPYLASDFNRTTAMVSATHVFPGTAICDWLPGIDALSSNDAPTVVALQFIGNDFTPCMSGYSPGSAAFLQKYATDLTTAITQLRSVGVKLVLVDLGPRTDDPAVTWYTALRAAYLKVVTSFHSSSVAYSSAADRAVETQAGRYVTSLSCLPQESRAGLCKTHSFETVRSKDGLHFCPATVGGANGQVSLCPVYSSGAYRFARGLSKDVWAAYPGTRPRQDPLVASLSATSGPASGGTSMRIRGGSFEAVEAVFFEVMTPSGAWIARGTHLDRRSVTSLTVVTPNLARVFHQSSGKVFVSVDTKTSQSPWLGLSQVAFRFG